jgi:hypothetical protein
MMTRGGGGGGGGAILLVTKCLFSLRSPLSLKLRDAVRRRGHFWIRTLHNFLFELRSSRTSRGTFSPLQTNVGKFSTELH